MSRRPLRTLVWALAAALLLIAAGALAALGFGLEAAPRVARPAAVSAGDLAAVGLQHARELFARRDDDGGAAGPLRRVALSRREAEWLLDQAANRVRPSATRLELRPGAALLRSSLALPAVPLLGERWINVEATLHDSQGGLPAVALLRVGRLPLPAWLGDVALRRALDRIAARLLFAPAGDDAAARLLADTVGLVRGVRFGADDVQVAVEWRGDSRDRLVGALWTAADTLRARAYHDRLAALAAAAGPTTSRAVSLAALLPPMFALARERSAAGGAPVQENRAALLTLALHASGRGWAALMPAARGWRQVAPLSITLRGRDDFPQHWLVSAAIAIEGGGPLADAIGLYKEMEDKRQGSGFSFNDIAADRAGARFGLLAVRSPAVLQARLADGVREADLLPDVADLPEFMSQAEFRRRYGDVGSPAYERTLADIAARVDALALLR